mgnify:CR=1 FL=1
MPRVYYGGDPATFMDVLQPDVQYWVSQGWATEPSNGATTSAPPAGAQNKPDPSIRLYLVSFSGDPTPNDATTGAALPWLYDTRDRLFRPFTSQDQLDAWVTVNGGDPSKTAALVVKLTPDDALTGNWQGSFLSTKYSPSTEDGSLPVYGSGTDALSPNVTERYGLPYDESAETKTSSSLSKMVAKWRVDGLLTQESLNTFNDHKVVAKYVSSIVYGGYLLQDIWRDLRINELAKTNQAYTALNGIDENMSAEDFKKTDAYFKLQADPALVAPAITIQGGIDLMKYPVYKMPDSFFQEQVPTIDWKDPKYQAEAEKIAAGLYDVILAQTEAKTEQDRLIADDNYRRFITATNKNYNLQLSLDAEKAWAQILDMQNTFENRGLSNSGILEEARDRHLKALRKKVGLDRENFKEKSDITLRDRLLGQASAAEIKEAIAKLNAEDAAAGKSPDQYRSVLWGLTPDQATLNEWSLANLKKAYPTYSDEQIQLIRDSFIDENGNYRSRFYQTAIGNKVNNRLDKLEYQRTTYLQDQADLAKQKNDDLYKAEFTNYQSPESKRLAQEQATAIEKEQTALAETQKTEAQKDKEAAEALFKTQPDAEIPPSVQSDPKGWVALMGGQLYVNGTLRGPGDGTSGKALAASLGSQWVGTFPAGYDIAGWGASKGYTIGTSPSGTQSQSSSAWAPPTGYEIINGAQYNTTATQQAAYSNIQTSPDGKHLYGQRKASTTSSTPTSSAPSSSPTPTSTTLLNNTGIWKPPEGFEIINGAMYNTTASQQGTYDNIQTSPDGKNLYGKRKAATQPATTSPASPTASSDPGYVQVRGPSGNVMRIAESNLSIWTSAGYVKV